MDIKDKYIIARWAYSIGKDYISDIEYDNIENELKQKNILSEYTSKGWSEDKCPYQLLKREGLDEFIVPVLYTYKTESIESLNSEDLVRDKFINLTEKSKIGYKLDGFSIRLSYYNGHIVVVMLRNRNEGRNTELFSIIELFKPTIDLKGQVLITGELCLKNSRFEEYCKLRGITSQRNGVATAIANGDVEFLTYKCYNIYSKDLDSNEDKYDILKKLGFSTPKYMYVDSYNSLLKAIEVLGQQNKYYGIPTDGLVIENSKVQYAIRVGVWEEELNKSYVTGYTFNRGMYNDSMLCTIRPIKLKDKTISEIDVTNIQTVIDNNLRVGYPICFVQRSAVNSVLDTTKTKELQDLWINKYDQFKKEVDSYE